jgi:hypothetical protein
MLLLVGKSEGKRTLEGRMLRWESNITIYLEEMRCKSANGLKWHRIGSSGSSCFDVSEPTAFIKNKFQPTG